MFPERLWSATQFFERLYINYELLEAWAAAGLISEYKVGKIVKYDVSEVLLRIQIVLNNQQTKINEAVPA